MTKSITHLECTAASNRWSVVFSNEANINTLSRIFATPKRVIPNISPEEKRQGQGGRGDGAGGRGGDRVNE